MKLTMMRGLPGSGKTTAARAQVEASGNDGRINRDDLRAMLFNSKWTGKREGIVIDCEKAIAEVLLKHNHNPIIDDTNLLEKHHDIWSAFTGRLGIGLNVQKMDTSILDCVTRDFMRAHSVGTPIIHRMALEAGMIDWGTQKIVLVDIDGTLADGSHREHFLKGPKKDWESYFEAMTYDEPVEAILKWVHALSADHTICIVSGRPDTYHSKTVHWLRRHDIFYDYLFMRRGNDKRDDDIIKPELLQWIPKEQVEMVLDDRPRVVRSWRAKGLKVYPVRGQIEEF